MNDSDTPEIRCRLRNLSRVTEYTRPSQEVISHSAAFYWKVAMPIFTLVKFYSITKKEN